MMRVSPERMSNEDKESLLSSQINCFGGNPKRTLNFHMLHVSEISISHQIETVAKERCNHMVSFHQSCCKLSLCSSTDKICPELQDYHGMFKGESCL